MSKKALQKLSSLLQRSRFFSQMGKTYSDIRDVYKALGWNKNPIYNDYYMRYIRQDIANRVVNAPATAIWSGLPVICEKDFEFGENTPFETSWKELAIKHQLFNVFNRCDRLLGMGKFSVLFLGFNDGKKSEEEVSGDHLDLLYVKPFSEKYATIKEYVTDLCDVRYGLPKLYQLEISIDENTTKNIEVHWTRIIHMYEGSLESEVYGAPRLECILNRLEDLDKIVGGSAEMFWRGAYPRFVSEAREGYDISSEDDDDLREQMDELADNLRRTLVLEGIDFKQLDPKLESPKEYVDVQMTLISSATSIPKRILTGSERGELASVQDENNWNKYVDERRRDFAEPIVLIPFIDRMIKYGVIEHPKEQGYDVKWSDLWARSEKEKAETARIYSEGLARYAGTPGTDLVIPHDVYLEKVMGMDLAEVKAITDKTSKMMEEEQKQIEQDEKIIEEEQKREEGMVVEKEKRIARS